MVYMIYLKLYARTIYIDQHKIETNLTISQYMFNGIVYLAQYTASYRSI